MPGLFKFCYLSKRRGRAAPASMIARPGTPDSGSFCCVTSSIYLVHSSVSIPEPPLKTSFPRKSLQSCRRLRLFYIRYQIIMFLALSLSLNVSLYFFLCSAHRFFSQHDAGIFALCLHQFSHMRFPHRSQRMILHRAFFQKQAIDIQFPLLDDSSIYRKRRAYDTGFLLTSFQKRVHDGANVPFRRRVKCRAILAV